MERGVLQRGTGSRMQMAKQPVARWRTEVYRRENLPRFGLLIAKQSAIDSILTFRTRLGHQTEAGTNWGEQIRLGQNGSCRSQQPKVKAKLLGGFTSRRPWARFRRTFHRRPIWGRWLW